MTLDTPTAEIAIIIAAKDAEAPVRETLAALQRQSYTVWEAVVVDDGSSDTTGSVAAAVAQVDARFQPVSVSADGVSQARNLGVEATRVEWLLFLDADDQLTYDALDVLLAQRSDRCDAVYAGWRRITPFGRLLIPEYGPAEGELTEVLALRHPFVIHACIVKRAPFIHVGGFDPSLTVGEDWDLWSRLARGDTRFVGIRRWVAYYNLRAASGSTRNLQEWLASALRLTARAQPSLHQSWESAGTEPGPADRNYGE